LPKMRGNLPLYPDTIHAWHDMGEGEYSEHIYVLRVGRAKKVEEKNDTKVIKIVGWMPGRCPA
jgi:hypothetical protein